MRDTVPYRHIFLIMAAILLFVACRNDYVPKPRGYIRIDLPEKEYVRFDTTYPYSFPYPVYSTVITDTGPATEPYWLDIVFPRFKAKIHISYKEVEGNLNRYLEDTRSMVMKHIPRANAIREEVFIFRESEVYGTVYHIEGIAAASPVQFFATDSSKHFLRGALYFQAAPNNDSLAPVIEFITRDIEQLCSRLRWKE